MASHSRVFCYQFFPTSSALQPPDLHRGLGCFPFARRYLGNLNDFFSSAYLDVSVQLLTSTLPMTSEVSIPTLNRDGLLHSETAGSQVLSTSPTSIAAMCVLPRLCIPRHPLSAL